MSDQQLPRNPGTPYEQMTAEELAALLRRDLEAEPGSGLDDETLLHVMQLYAGKTDKPPKTAREAFAEFQQDYLSQGEDSATRDEAELHRRKTRRWRFVTTSAAVVTLVLCAGFCVRAGVFKGGQPTFCQNRDSLVVSGACGKDGTASVREIARQCFPQWLPEGYECVQNRWSDEFCAAVYYRGEMSQEDCLTVSVQAIGANQNVRFYKDPESAKTFTHDGVSFYLYHNAQWTGAVGCTDGVLISVNAKASEEEMLRIVRSMPFHEGK